MVKVYLLLGSNLGNRENYLKQAEGCIETEAGAVLQCSDIYETQSWGKTDAPDYLNQVLLIKTTLPPQELLARLLSIELILGRKREEKWGARTIDIDILFYGDEIIEEPNLVIPHPEMHNRRFTLEPLAQIAPDLIHPTLHQTITELKNNLKDKLDVKKIYF
ncbi:2-amino-4-hydroxy-6-hydroxymethyldihydropteridine diphosphokinase [Mucilaginibacter sp. PAMB04274]|uniref:2-amino-4-hydroxy-6- hydroxymethyldihydropteridine diphosphokinase n=1 Tax=Mucilaginibacter sp. PAMB04274 TaxID=3138568 RepID=UPI0031F66F7D